MELAKEDTKTLKAAMQTPTKATFLESYFCARAPPRGAKTRIEPNAMDPTKAAKNISDFYYFGEIFSMKCVRNFAFLSL